ncbi:MULTISPECIES: 4-hydroxybenzoate 3-monooxygenase [Streptomyces]|uniref:4-hydroxybenzoate 3-monooxygenase n=1 Tax=Streptomyces doudnae TaxID=3075536 RepID=A0ABD5ERU5_9ACTN|nr:MULTISPECIES: 4-hydroxybenzoate 3-monooxygenase [unclassified Streptomyces]MDT0436389.1 4-hydroxybenzoate 3-monooxygenase [Streptomyces sp. DSM 41981]MYQ68766.1 4-hydroxybenzoate 3-monooxygenase [Streptomyces sp. SID4950]SCE48861.1 p-hydroxybenzoate 3-monooxygenase [Streptomyces sp. SolWspMP-5a-2]
MTDTHDDTSVVIIGAGVAGLTLANFLLRNGIDCVVLEKHARSYVEKRQRAGTIDTFGVRLFREWGLEEVLEGDPIPHSEGGFYIDGRAMPITMDEDGNESLYCPQQVLVRNLTDVFLREGGDLRYEAVDVTLENLTEGRPSVRHRDAEGGTRAIACDFIAGCDGFHGVSRRSIPASALTEYAYEHGYSWLSVLAAAETRPSGMAIHELGLAGMIPRGPGASRIYLQCAVDDTPEQWPDERIWSALEARFGTPASRGEILSKQVVPLRSVVFAPMSHGRLFLLGDAAHIVPPMSAKGIHLALHDTEVFARAVIRHAEKNDSSLLDSYSESCLPHIWNYQAFATWITDIMHNAGLDGYEGAFKKQIARAELQRQFTSEAANKLFSELAAGTN